MKYIYIVLLGVVFGIVLTKSEFISWYRWQEMFLMKSFHLYGLMITAVLFGILWIRLIKWKEIKDIDYLPIEIPNKNISFYRYAIGGLIFGLGWAISGCPGVTYVLIGHGYWIWIVILMSAILGTLIYGLIRNKLPH